VSAPLLLVGSKVPLSLDVETLARRMQGDAVRADLARLGMGTPAELFELFIAGPAGTRAWLAGATPVTDDRTVVDFTTPRAVYSGFGFGYSKLTGADAEALRRHVQEVRAMYDRLREPIAPLLTSAGDRATRTLAPPGR